MSEAPEFHTTPSTPLSPLPVHPPEPSNVKVLREQIDPVFNMTSTHLRATEMVSDAASPMILATHESSVASNDSSFDDAYVGREQGPRRAAEIHAPQPTDLDDDYAMTFDSEADADQDHSKTDSPVELHTPTHDTQQDLASAFSEVAAFPTSTSAAQESSPVAESHHSSVPQSAEAAPPTHETNTALQPSKSLSPGGQSRTYEEIASGEIDIQQLLDDITANAELKSAADPPTPSASSLQTTAAIPAPILPVHSSLPPRPQAVQLPPAQSAYASANNVRSYQTSSLPPPPGLGASYGAPGVPEPSRTSGAPGTTSDIRSALSPPLSASMFLGPPGVVMPSAPLHFHPPARSAAQPLNAHTRHESKNSERVDGPDYGEVRFSPVMQKMYDEFIEDERGYSTDVQLAKFPPGSRLFVGNLPSEKVTKKDIFFQFHKYGRLAQISIKQAFGFVQFLQAASCQRALEREQDHLIRGRKMHLEISKAQRNARQTTATANNGTAGSKPRLRQDDKHYESDRGVDRGPGRGNQLPTRSDNTRGGVDRYENRGRDDDFRGPPRGRDDRRPVYRSPSPQSRNGYNPRGREDYPPRGDREYLDGGRRRSRSISPPYGRRDSGRYRDRSPPPRNREQDEDASLQIPRREPRHVPDVFIVLVDDLARDFVSWVEGEIRSRDLKTEVMHLNPRIPLDAVIRRQVLEGVHAVIILTQAAQNASKIPLRVFDRRGGANNIRFDEYQDLDPKIAAELVVRIKPASQPAQQPNQVYQPSQATPAAVPNIANIVGTLDNAALQKLLGSLGVGKLQQPQQANSQSNPSIDLAGMLGGLNQQQNYQHQTQNGYSGMNPAASSSHGGTPSGHDQQSQQQVQSIMAQLARFKQ